MNPGAWVRRIGGPERPVVLAALTVRLAGLVMIAYAIPLAWPFLPHPGWSLLLDLAVVVEAGVSVWWWLRDGRVGPSTVWLELPVGIVVIVGGALLGQHIGDRGFTGYTYSYTVLVALILGLAARTWWGTVAAGLAWGLSAALAGMVNHPVLSAWTVVPSYLLNPLVGWTCARLLRRSIVELDVARQRAVRHAAELATERERMRHAHAMHDRVLQTLETLARPGAVAEPALAGRLSEEAAWLRRFVENGEVDQRDDLVSALAAAARAVAPIGVAVQLNDAALRADEADRPALPEAAREALVAALYQTLIALGGAGEATDESTMDGRRANLVVRGSPERGGVLITVLATDPGRPTDPDEIDQARARLTQAGGAMTLDQLPYAELWVPGPTRADPDL